MLQLYPDTARKRGALLRMLGTILVILAALYGIVIAAAIAGQAPLAAIAHFGIPCLILLTTGLLLRRKRNAAARLRLGDAGPAIFWGWVILVIAAMPPFMTLSGMTVIQALFESISGWTTTGLSVVEYAGTNSLIFLWRSILQLAGGAGLAILLVSISGGASGSLYSRVEGRDLLVPHVKDSARLVLRLYAIYLIVGVLSYMAVGLSFYESFNHACAAISTGGFSNRPESIGTWDSVYVEGVSIALMILGNMNFITAWLLARGKWTLLGRNSELRLMVVAIAAGAVLVYVFTTAHVYADFSKDGRVAFFETVSALTTTGFSTTSYTSWSHTGILVLIILMVIGGGACSTAGGLKQIRVYILWKSMVRAVRTFILPRGATLPLRVHDGERWRNVTEGELSALSAFTILYLAFLTAGTLLLTMQGYSLSDSLFEFASALGTVGISIGITGPHTPAMPLLAMSAAMLLGRLEIFLVFFGIKGALRLLHRKPGGGSQ
ncbi:MAG: TrkH family potassium uptake protein [Bacteroidetes bacterium]|nr:TrkH family potassium uptake protein [Bacteroidota bacterium]